MTLLQLTKKVVEVSLPSMSFLKKKISYRLSVSTIFFFAFFVSIIMGSIQTVFATDPTDPATCATAGGVCEDAYTFGVSRSCSAGTKQGMCHVATASENSSSSQQCCVGAIPGACAAPNSCATPQGGDCPSGRLVESGSCDAGKLCCTPSAPASCPGTCRPLSPGCGATETSSGGTCSSGICCISSATGGASAPISFKNPLKFDTVEGVLGSILGTLRGIIVVLALVFIVIGAILYITSAGNDERMKTAKGAITASMIGLALGIAAPSFLKQIGDILKWGDVTNSLPAETRTLTEIALSVLQFLLSIVGILGIIMLVIGGLAYLTSAGNEERADSGKKIVTYAIIGIAVALAALIAVTQIATLFV